jgi:phage protein D
MALGYPGANRREARKLGLLRSKSSEAERERMEPQERNERVCEGCPDAMVILDASFSFFEDAARCAAWVIV